MRELLVETLSGETEEGQASSYSYYILIDQMKVDGALACESYGVKIAQAGGENIEIPNITVSITRIDELVELMTRNLVTPSTLADVVADWL